jgi:hypothetical protein
MDNGQMLLIPALLLTLVAAIWGQIWNTTYQIYAERAKQRGETALSSAVSWGLSLVYAVALSSLVAFVCFLLSTLVKWDSLVNFGIGVLMVSVYLMVVQVMQSLVSAFNKYIKAKEFAEIYRTISLHQLRVAMYVIVSLGTGIFVVLELYLFGIL